MNVDEPPGAADSAAGEPGQTNMCEGPDTPLNYVPVDVNGRDAGGWYRQVTDDEIEVMTLARVKRVDLQEQTPEQAARDTLENLIQEKHGLHRGGGTSRNSGPH